MKVLVITSYNDPLDDWSMAITGAKAAAKVVNAEGGINGHPLEIAACNDLEIDPNKAANCGREAASGNYVAAIVESIQSEIIVPILEKAGVPDVGGYVDTPPDLESPVAYPIFPGQETFDEVWPKVIASEGKKSVSGVLFEEGSTVEDAHNLEVGAKEAGIAYKGLIGVPPETTDFTSIAQEIGNSGTEAAITLITPAQIGSLLRSAQELGVEAPIAVTEWLIGQEALETIGPAAEGMVTLSGTPPATAADKIPAMADFVEQMEAVGSDGGEDYRPQAVQAWFATHAIAMVGDRIKGAVTSQSLKKELDTQTPVNLFGLLNWVPGGKGPGKYKRLANGTVYYGEVESSEIHLKETFDSFKLSK